MQEVFWVISNLQIRDIFDILIVALMFFTGTFLFRGTQAVALFRGVIFLVVGLLLLAGVLQLQALSWLLSNGITVLAVAIPIIFQPELRRALEQIGRGGQLFNRQAPEDARVLIINEVVRAAEELSDRKHGALIVLQRNSSVEDFIRTGVPINSDVNAELMLTIFWPKTELHDGAVIIDNDGRIAAAAAVLPLTASRNLPDNKMGTRHRASLGISEAGDAICVVVSEETGKIAITNNGKMVPKLDTDRLRQILMAFYGSDTATTQTLYTRIRNMLNFLFLNRTSSQPKKAT